MFGYKITNQIYQPNRVFFFEKETIAERDIYLNQRIADNSYGEPERWIKDDNLPDHLLGRKKYENGEPVSRIVDNDTEWLIKADYIIEELNIDRELEQEQRDVLDDMNFGQSLVRLIIALNRRANITPEQENTIYSDQSVMAIINMLNNGSIEHVRPLIVSLDLTNLVPIDESFRNILLAKIDERLGV
jgi:hypothetical protein